VIILSLATEISNYIEELSEQEKVDVPEWGWASGLLVFTSCKEKKILVDQIYKHVWQPKVVMKFRKVILLLLRYEIAFAFYYYVTDKESDYKRDVVPEAPDDEDAREFAEEKTDINAEEYFDAAFKFFDTLARKYDLIDMLIHY